MCCPAGFSLVSGTRASGISSPDDKGPWPSICTSDYDIVVARDSAVPIMDGNPNGVGLIMNIYYHPFSCK